MEHSRALEYAERFRPLGREAARRTARAAWRQLSVLERAAVASDWSFWARPRQLPPAGAWQTWGFLTGRGWGKTVAISKFVNDEVEAGRARLVGLAAQDEANSVAIQVTGPSGLIATAPPWFRPRFEASSMQVVWPNGARGYVRTPEVPGKIRGLEYELFWASELQSWPNSTREEAWSNVMISTRIGLAHIVWDSTSKRRHPILKELLAQAEANPAAHRVVRGTTHENAANLAANYVAEMERKYGGTAKGREELLGELLADSESALVKQAWIDTARRPMPDKFRRRVIGIDPAVTDRKGSDTTGIVEVGLGFDGQAYPLRDASAKHKPEAWAGIALDWYVGDACDLILAETNKGGSLVVQNLRAMAKERDLEIIVIGKDDRAPPRQEGKVFVREVYARGSKEDRAEPVATAYERGRISHVLGRDLPGLEDTLTTWEPAPNADSPGDLDALVHAVVEILEFANAAPNLSQGFVGIDKVAKEIAAPKRLTSLSHVLLVGGRGDRI